MKTTFEHKFDLGDVVWFHSTLCGEIKEGVVINISWGMAFHEITPASYVVANDGMTEQFDESEIFATKAELLKALNHDNKN